MAILIFKERLNAIHPLREDLWKSVEPTLFHQKYDQGEIWLNAGNKGHKLGFIVTGGAKSIFKDGSVKKADKLWLHENMIISSTLFTREGSKQTIEFTADSDVVQFSINSIESHQEEHREDLRRYINHYLGSTFTSHEERIRWLSAKNGEQRYKEAIELYGDQFLNLTSSNKLFL